MSDFKPVFIVRYIGTESSSINVHVCFSLKEAMDFIAKSYNNSSFIEEWYQRDMCAYYSPEGILVEDDQ